MFLTFVTTEPDGRITGFDPQNGANYAGIEEVSRGMMSDNFDLMYKLASPPAEGSR